MPNCFITHAGESALRYADLRRNELIVLLASIPGKMSAGMRMTTIASPALCGDIIDAVTALHHMRGYLPTLRNSQVVVISAYLKVTALNELLGQLHPSNQVRILVRWQPNDLLAGASDVDSCVLAGEKGWQFCARQDLHAKVYSFGDEAIFIGSANLTSKGFSVYGIGNAELMVKVPATPANLVRLDALFDGAVVIDDKTLASIAAWLNAQPPIIQKSPEMAWPASLLSMMTPLLPVTELMISECFRTDGRDAHEKLVEKVSEAVSHDFSLLALPVSMGRTVDINLLTATFIRSKMFRWLQTTLEEESAGELYFGHASALLHDALIDDYRPHRQDVKILLSNLLSWIDLSPSCGVTVDRPGHSQRIRVTV